MPSTNLSTGLSTKPTRLIPDYLAKNQKYIPLSVFFAGIPEEEAEKDSLFGYRMPERKKQELPSKEKKTKGGSTNSDKDQKQKDDDEDSEKSKEKSKEQPQSAPASKSDSQPDQAATKSESFQKWQSTAISERMKWLLKVANEATTTANISTLPVPIGAGDGRKFLDRPGDKKKKKSLSSKLYILLRQ
jgi:hypothetical protein